MDYFNTRSSDILEMNSNLLESIGVISSALYSLSTRNTSIESQSVVNSYFSVCDKILVQPINNLRKIQATYMGSIRQVNLKKYNCNTNFFNIIN